MSISDKFQLTTTYQAIEISSTDMTAGTFIIQNTTGATIGWKTATSLPAATDSPDFYMGGKGSTDKLTLAALEFWYARTESIASASIGVIES